jgi:hypothetical protein
LARSLAFAQDRALPNATEQGIVEAARQLSAAAEADMEGQQTPDDIEVPLEDLAGATNG